MIIKFSINLVLLSIFLTFLYGVYKLSTFEKSLVESLILRFEATLYFVSFLMFIVLSAIARKQILKMLKDVNLGG
jgi:hypothetical protein